MTPDVSPKRGVELHQQLRAFLLATMGQESPAAIAGALMYEITSLAATISTSRDQALELLVDLLEGAEEQLDAFGVGRPHP